MFHPKATLETVACITLAFHPGTAWIYGISIIWVGKLVERVSGQRLDDYFRKNIFDKVEGGMPDISFFPTEEIMRRKMRMCRRDEDGGISPVDGFGLGRPTTVEGVSTDLLLGGEGLFGTLKDYLALLRAILQCDPRYSSPNPLLKPSTYAEMFSGSVKNKEGLINMLSPPGYLDPAPAEDNVDHSVTFALRTGDSVNARKGGSGFWSGVARTQYWIDPKTGVAVGHNETE